MQRQAELWSDDGCCEPAVLKLPSLAAIAFTAEHLQVAQLEREFGIQRPRLDVIDDELRAVVPFRLAVDHALRPAAVCGGIGTQRLVAKFRPFGGAVEGPVVEDLSSGQHGLTPVKHASNHAPGEVGCSTGVMGRHGKNRT